jgi:hypothetical protein
MRLWWSVLRNYFTQKGQITVWKQREIMAMQTQPTNEVSAEPESKLWEAHGQYMRGEIDLGQLEAVKQTYGSSPIGSASPGDYYASAAKSRISVVVDHVVDYVCNLITDRK